jgi:hypothetical protein
MTTSGNVPITGTAPRTLVAMLARDNATTTAGRAAVGIGSGANAFSFEIGTDSAKTYLSGVSGDRDTNLLAPIPVADQFIFVAGANGHGGNFARGVQAWRSTGPEPETLTSIWPADLGTASGPFSISRRAAVIYRGKIGEVLLFDRILTDGEISELREYLWFKWNTGSTPDTSFDGTAFDVADGATLDLGASERTGITVTGGGTVTNGILGAGFVISPAGDDAIGELAFHNVIFGQGVEYRLTTSGGASDRILADGDLSGITLVPADVNNLPAAKEYTVATGAITAKPALSPLFPSKYKLRQRGDDLLLTSVGGTLIILK